MSQKALGVQVRKVIRASLGATEKTLDHKLPRHPRAGRPSMQPRAARGKAKPSSRTVTVMIKLLVR